MQQNVWGLIVFLLSSLLQTYWLLSRWMELPSCIFLLVGLPFSEIPISLLVCGIWHTCELYLAPLNLHWWFTLHFSWDGLRLNLNGVIKTNYLGDEIPKENVHYTCIACLSIDSVMKMEKKNYLKVYLEEGKYKIKK